jgi:hypothetical protein
MYLLQPTVFRLSSYLLPTTMPFSLSGDNLIFYSSFNSHRPRTNCYSLVAANSLVLQRLPMVSPLLFVLNKCKEFNSMKHPTYITYFILPFTLSITTMQHKIFESFNHLPLKSHTKYVHFSSILPSLSKGEFSISHTNI